MSNPKRFEDLTRLENWRARFEQAIDDIKFTPFAWGSHDCGPGLAGRLVEALTGVDIAAPWRGRYDTAAGALTCVAKAGYTDLADLIADLLPEIHPAQAGIGDIVAVPVDSPLKHALGVVNGERVFVLSETGVGTVDLLTATRAFKVG